jgi:hypothetical protein
MTPQPRRPRLAGLLLAIALIGLGAGCASKPGAENTATGETGSGQLGDVPATAEATPTVVPTPTSTSVGEDGTPDPVPSTPGPKLTLIINPSILLLAWPSPADCVTYNPATVSISYAAPTQTWSIVDGPQGLLVFKRQADADAGLALAKSYKKHCWIGRTNTRSNHGAYVMDYWLDPVAGAAAVPNPDCLPHTAAQLAVVSSGTSGWLVTNGNEAVKLLDTKADADNAVLVMKHYNRHCYIGRGNGKATTFDDYITNWFAAV